MYYTTNFDEFAARNQRELLKFLRYKLQTTDDNILMDRLQDCYLALLKNDSLRKWDPALGCSFSTYICNVMMWGSVKRKIENSRAAAIETMDMDTHTASAAERDLHDRIVDYRTWLTRHGGLQVDAILQNLEERILGDISSDAAGQSQYRQHLKKFLAAESTPAPDCPSSPST